MTKWGAVQLWHQQNGEAATEILQNASAKFSSVAPRWRYFDAEREEARQQAQVQRRSAGGAADAAEQGGLLRRAPRQSRFPGQPKPYQARVGLGVRRGGKDVFLSSW